MCAPPESLYGTLGGRAASRLRLAPIDDDGKPRWGEARRNWDEERRRLEAAGAWSFQYMRIVTPWNLLIIGSGRPAHFTLELIAVLDVREQLVIAATLRLLTLPP